MQKTEFGQDIPRSGGNFLRVKNAGDKITFRLAQPPVHTGKHFLTDESGKWNVVGCPRINEAEECEYCESYFAIMAEAKEAEAKGDKAASDALKETAREGGKQVALQFYYPVLNRDTESFGILQTTYGVKKKIDDMFNNGVKVTERDMVLGNTGKPAAALYALTVVDSADSTALTEKEVEEYAKAKNFDTSTISDTKQNADPDAVVEEDSETIKVAEEIFGDKPKEVQP